MIGRFYAHAIDLPEDRNCWSRKKVSEELNIAYKNQKYPFDDVAIPVTNAIIRVVTAPQWMMKN